MRICDECRYRLMAQNYKPVEKLTSKLEEEKAAKEALAAGITTISNCNVAGCRDRAVTVDGLCSAHAAKKKEMANMNTGVTSTVKIYWEGKAEVLATIPAGPSTSLAAIDLLFRKQAPQSEAYIYIYRGDPVPDNFLDVFNVQKVGQQIYIRTKLANSGVSKEALALANQVSQIVISANETNPFKRSENEIIIAKRKEEEAKKNKKKFHSPATFKQVAAVSPVKPKLDKATSNGKNTALTGPAAAALHGEPTGVSAPVLPKQGQTVEDLLKSRAKTIFGQK